MKKLKIDAQIFIDLMRCETEMVDILMVGNLSGDAERQLRLAVLALQKLMPMIESEVI
jgi:hypothetical protein